MNQYKAVLHYIEQFGSITPLDAFKDLSIMRLGARIHNLRAQGYDIKTKLETSKNRFGSPVTYARYYIKERRVK